MRRIIGLLIGALSVLDLVGIGAVGAAQFGAGPVHRESPQVQAPGRFASTSTTGPTLVHQRRPVDPTEAASRFADTVSAYVDRLEAAQRAAREAAARRAAAARAAEEKANSERPISGCDPDTWRGSLSANERSIIEYEHGLDSLDQASDYRLTHAYNPTETSTGHAFGMGQLTDGNRERFGAELGVSASTVNPCAQLGMMRMYITERYGSSGNAVRFWESHHWY